MTTLAHAVRRLAAVLVPALGLLFLTTGCPSSDGGGGAPTFSKSFGSSASDLASGGAATPDGGYVFVGAWGGRTHEDRFVDEDLWVTKLDAFGDVEWSHVYTENLAAVPDASEVVVQHLAVARRGGGFFLVGTVDDYAVPGAADDARRDLVVTRLDDDGNVVWTETYAIGAVPLLAPAFPGEGTEESPVAAVATASGGLYVGGMATGRVLDDGERLDVHAPFVLRIGAAGNLVWQRVLEEDLYRVFGYYNEVLHLAETADGGVVAAIPMLVESDGLTLDSAEDATRVTRLDADGDTVWTVRHDGFAARSVEPFTRFEIGGAEAFLLAAESYDSLSADDRELRTLDAAGNLVTTEDLGDLDRSLDATVLTTSSEDRYTCAVGLVRGDGATDHLRLEFFGHALDGDLVHLDGLDLPWLTALHDLRTFDDGNGSIGYELLASDLADPGSRSGDLWNLRVSPTGTILRNQDYPRTMPGQLSAEGQLGRRHAGWADGVDDYWLWTPDHFLGDSPNMTLGRYHLTAGRIWSRTFSPSTDRRLERALDVEVFADPQGGFELAVLGAVAWDPFQNPPPEDEPLSAWYLRLDADGNVLAERVLEECGVADDRRWYAGGLAAGPRPRLRRSSDLLAAAPDGEVYVGGLVEGFPRVTRLARTGDVAWCSRPLADAFEGEVLALAPLADGGVAACGTRWVARLGADGSLAWRVTAEADSLGGLCELASGDLLVSATDRGRPGYVRLAPDGTWLGDVRLTDEVAAWYDEVLPVASTADGGAVIACGRLSEEALEAEAPLGTYPWDLRLVAIDADGLPTWSQTWGALLEESVGGLTVLPDGGLLLTGRSDSLGEGSEAWVVRMDSCGEVNGACQAQLVREDPASTSTAPLGFAVAPVTAGLPAQIDVAGQVFSYGTSVQRLSRTAEVVVARQCSGTSKDAPVGSPFVTLTVVIESGVGSVVEVVGAGRTPRVVCPGTCEAVVERGETVVLEGMPMDGVSMPSWVGGDCGGEPRATCEVTMDGDRTVRVQFGGGGYSGLADLLIQFAGEGSGSVLVQGTGVVCTEGCVLEDLASPGETYTLIATPGEGSGFGGWSGVDSGDGNVALVEFGMADRTVVVTFD